MTFSGLIFPQVKIKKGDILTLWPLFKYISIGRVSNSSKKKVLFSFVTESLDYLLNASNFHTLKKITQKNSQMKLLFKDWEEWLVHYRDSGQIEILKAKLLNFLEFKYDNVQFLSETIKSYNRQYEEKKGKVIFSLCEEEAIFLLYLLEQQDQLIEEAKTLFAQTEISQKKIRDILELATEDDKYFASIFNYNKYSQLASEQYGEDNNKLSRQLQAWATLAINLDLSNFLLITTNASIVDILINRANSLISSRKKFFPFLNYELSPKFLESISYFNLNSLIQEVFRLTLPNLVIHNESELLIFYDKLMLDGQIEKNRQDLVKLLSYFNEENWSINFKKELSRRAILLNKEFNSLVINLAKASFNKITFINRTLRVFALPKLTRIELLGLMMNYKNNELLHLVNSKSVKSIPLGLLF